MGYNAVCFNSETSGIDGGTISLLKESFDYVLICYDNDAIGTKESKKIANKFNIAIVDIDYILYHSNACKDVADYIKATLADNINSNYHVVLKPNEYSHGVEEAILNARGIQFEPTLRLDPAEPNKLVIRAGDTTRPIFGFSHIRGRISTNPSDQNFNRLIVDSLSLVGQVILDEPWPKNQFTRQGYNYVDTNLYILDSFLLDKMYLSINLRRNTFKYSGDTILKI